MAYANNFMWRNNVYSHVFPALKNKLVFDIGAASGEVTKLMLSYGCNVLAVEPQEAHISNANFDKCVAVVNKCVSAKIGSTKFLQCLSDRNLSSCEDFWVTVPRKIKLDWASTVKDCVTLDSLIVDYDLPVFIKIDVEGHENEVIKGFTNTGVKYVYLECSVGFEQYYVPVFKKLESLGYSDYVVYVSNHKKKSFHALPISGLDNLVKYYTGRVDWIQCDILFTAACT